jgi:hypothetical protein
MSLVTAAKIRSSLDPLSMVVSKAIKVNGAKRGFKVDPDGCREISSAMPDGTIDGQNARLAIVRNAVMNRAKVLSGKRFNCCELSIHQCKPSR